MKFINIIATICLGLFVCLVSQTQAGGDKSAKTTVITLAGGGDKGGHGYPIPIPIPICSNGKSYGGGFGRRR